MFVSTKGFKKLIKASYDTDGLTVGASDEEYFFEGGSWVIRVEKEHLPNKEKAAVIELTGELPAAGEVFKAKKKCPNQYLIPDNQVWNIGEQILEAHEKFNITKALFETNDYRVRVLQNAQNNLCVPISEVFTSMIDSKAIDEGNEDLPTGPYRRKDGSIMYWKNSIMIMAACIISEPEDSPLAEYLRLLTSIELPKEKMIY